MDLGIKAKRALVLGASAGLGYAVARELVAEGARVCVASRDADRIESARHIMGAEAAITCDLSRPGEGARAVRDAAAKLGGAIEILVTNTGGPPKGAFETLSSGAWQQGFESLWLSAVESMREALPGMRAAGFGRILLVTSAAAREPMAGLTVSNGLRAGLLGLMKSVSHEVAAAGITVNSILPGYTDTERLQELKVPRDKIVSQIPAGRIGEPEEFAAVATFLCSARASYLTGQAIAVDGGYLRGI